MTKIIAVVGATASGKSALGIRLAKELDGEIVSCDSAQVYRGMDIGTAKVTAEERLAAVHHLIDVADINEPFSAGRFAAMASDTVENIAARGKIPLLVGGTGLYVDAVTTGNLDNEADSNPAVRAELLRKAESEGAEALHTYLASVDPQSAAEIHPNNIKRVARALEIFLVTGKTKTELNAIAPPQRFDRLLLILDTPDRSALYARIDRRVDEMMEAGLTDEARRLWEAGLAKTPTASQSIGYKELFPYFEGLVSLDEAVDKIKQATRNYAKRQLTYFRRMKGGHYIDCSNGADAVFEAAMALCRSFL